MEKNIKPDLALTGHLVLGITSDNALVCLAGVNEDLGNQRLPFNTLKCAKFVDSKDKTSLSEFV